MEKKIAVINIPIGVGERGFPLGLTISPLVADTLAKNIGASNILGINTLDTYKKNRDVFIPRYLTELKKLNILPDAIWNDRKQLNDLLKVFKKLEENGFLYKSTEKVLECECGKVEILKNVETREEARLYRKEKDEISCKECGQTHEKEKEVLLMKFPEKIKRPQIFTSVNQKEVNELFNRIEGMKYLVSRTRNTGVEFEGFNIDVDFTFLNFLNTINFEKYIIVGSNHVNWHLCMATVLKKCIEPESEITVISTPYIYDKNHVLPLIEENLKNNVQLKKAFLLSSLTWNRISTNWSLETFKTLEKINEEDLSLILKEMNKKIEGKSFEDVILKSLKHMKKKSIIDFNKKFKEMEKW